MLINILYLPNYELVKTAKLMIFKKIEFNCKCNKIFFLVTTKYSNNTLKFQNRIFIKTKCLLLLSQKYI